MKQPDPRAITAASYRRLAKALRVKASNYKRAAKLVNAMIPEQTAYLNLRALVAIDLADEFEQEARALKAKPN